MSPFFLTFAAGDEPLTLEIPYINMRILIFDTETGGISPENNDILQLSYQVVDIDTLETLKVVNHYFPWPEDKWRVDEGAIRVNGLTEEFLATKQLSDRYEALQQFFDDMYACTYVVAHNGTFDKRFVEAEAERLRYKIGPDEWKPLIDTMRTTTDLCQIPNRNGYKGYKWPRLSELAEHLGVDTSDIALHDSSADVELTKRCFLYLLDMHFYNL